MDAALPECYYATHFVVEGYRPGPHLTLAIVTAFNPMDRICPEEVNLDADERLRSELLSAGHDPFRATGGSPDGSHWEPGWAFEAPFEEALKISIRFKQRAFWWVMEDRLNLVSSADPKPIEVASFSDRILEAKGPSPPDTTPDSDKS